MKLSYHEPAKRWTEALPVGNGRLGAMVFGGVEEELLQLNEETLWSGSKTDWNNPGAAGIIPQMQEAVRLEQYDRADELCKQTMGPYTQSYLPFGDLRLSFHHDGTVGEYQRELDLDSGCVRVSYMVNEVRYSREFFCSYPDQSIVVKMHTSKPGTLCLKVELSSPLQYEVQGEEDTLQIHGLAPEYDFPNYYTDVTDPIRYGDPENTRALSFAGQLHLQAEGEEAKINRAEDALTVKGADQVFLIFCAATSYGMTDCDYHVNLLNHRSRLAKLDEALSQHMSQVKAMAYSELKRRHKEDYCELYHRVQLSLGDQNQSYEEKDTATRLREYNPADTGLVELMFQYGRYLLISSSRPGGKPTNLQGIWNKELQPPWSSNYTTDINTEMNYWIAETCNLSECHLPLLDFIEELAENGKETARINYQSRGWVAHINTDIWAQSAPVGEYGFGEPIWVFWPVAGIWFCQHLWEHYAFGGDVDYLEQRAYPIMKEAALFCLDWMIVNEDGWLVTRLSTSPEHKFMHKGKLSAISAGCTMDMTLIWDLFTNLIEASEVLDKDEEFRKTLIATRSRLYPLQVGKMGQLQEWYHDFEEEESQHRHLSHLFPLYPGRQIKSEDTKYLDAVRRTLEVRGDISTGWGLAWRALLWARLGDGERALKVFHNQFFLLEGDDSAYHRGGVYPNLLGAHPPFQIDGNFGSTATVVEMLLQSHQGYIQLLPALPQSWAKGEFRGLKARGGFVIDLQWIDGSPTSGVIHSTCGNTCKIVTEKNCSVTVNGQDVLVEKNGNLYCFETNRELTYTLTFL